MGYVPDLHKIWVGTSDQQLMALSNEFPGFYRYALLMYALIMEEASEAERNKASRPYDPRVDALLASPNVKALRRCWNGVFHFQPDYFSAKLLEPMQASDFIGWVRADGCERTGQRGGDHAFAGSHGHGWYDLGLLAHACGTRPTLATVAAPVCRLPRPDGAEGRAFWRQAPKVIA